MVGVLIPFLMSAYCVFSITYLFPEIANAMHVSISELSFAVTLSFIGGAIGGVVVGMLADAYGRKVGLVISIVLFSVFTMLAGLASNLLELYATWFVVGFGVNSENGITYPVIAENWTRGRGLMGGIVQGLYFIGLMIDAAVISLIPQWRLALIIIGASSLVLSLPWVLIIPETVRRAGITGVKYGELFGRDYLLITIFGTILVASAFLLTIPLVSLAPTYLRIIDAKPLGLWLVALPIIGAVAYGLAGYLSDVFGRDRTLIALSIIAVVASALLSTTSAITTLRYSIPYSMVLAYFSSSIFAYLGIWMSELYPTRVRATASNFVFTLGRILGGVGPTLVAMTFIENLGFGIGVVMMICSVLALISTLILRSAARSIALRQ
ncbi:MFS transporter [Vulcanisaeta sp. JCM 14467]|uniref:MFS transporter n=1 Tax=Vulcanisaeta sp. JCM 14467 TaxID=1295370 RepID=UPI002093FAA6|nr:MFS transporter [Vulcanisaeta sp. JCM 14467]